MQPSELRIGNLLQHNSHIDQVVEILENGWIKVKHDNKESALQVYKPIPLTEQWLERIPIIKVLVPSWIQSIHELQNWYYWNNGKIELPITEKIINEIQSSISLSTSPR